MSRTRVQVSLRESSNVGGDAGEREMDDRPRKRSVRVLEDQYQLGSAFGHTLPRKAWGEVFPHAVPGRAARHLGSIGEGVAREAQRGRSVETGLVPGELGVTGSAIAQ
jgi:hypothetical protein